MTGNIFTDIPYFINDLSGTIGGALILGLLILIVAAVLMLWLLRNKRKSVRMTGLSLLGVGIIGACLVAIPALTSTTTWTPTQGEVVHADISTGDGAPKAIAFAYKSNTIVDGMYLYDKEYGCLGDHCNEVADLDVYVHGMCHTLMWPNVAIPDVKTGCVIDKVTKDVAH